MVNIARVIYIFVDEGGDIAGITFTWSKATFCLLSVLEVWALNAVRIALALGSSQFSIFCMDVGKPSVWGFSSG
jgi:hypothetical protein